MIKELRNIDQRELYFLSKEEMVLSLLFILFKNKEFFKGTAVYTCAALTLILAMGFLKSLRSNTPYYINI